MPQAIYWNILDETLTSGVGIGAFLEFKNLELSFTIDDPIVHDPKRTAKTFTGTTLNQTQTSFGDHMIATAKYQFEKIPVMIKSSWTRLNLGDDYSDNLPKFISPKILRDDLISDFFTFGVEYKDHGWTLSGETLWFQNPNAKSAFDFERVSKGFSLTAEYEIMENLSARVNYNEYRSISDRLHPHRGYSKDFNIGLNYHRNQWIFQVEGHRVSGGRWVSPDDFQRNPNAYKDWWMIGANLVYFFD